MQKFMMKKCLTLHFSLENYVLIVLKKDFILTQAFNKPNFFLDSLGEKHDFIK